MADEHTWARAMVEALDEPALLVVGERLILANNAARSLLGDQSVGSDVRLAIRQPQALAAILAGQRTDLEVAGIGGHDRPWEVRIRRVGEDALLVRLLDRTAMRAAEQMRVDFVANASHELRTPLATIIGYAETLAEDGELPAETRQRFVRSTLGEARRMLRIVQDLLSLSRIEADRFARPSERVDIADIVRLASEHGTHLAQSRGCSLRVQIANDLPDVAGDFGQLLQLMDNLVGNAVRYGCSPQAPEVTISARRDRAGVLLSVRDRGEGIPALHLPRLTERFYRVDAARSRDSGGTGLGLAIVKHIVERHRGTLTIVSKPGQGTDVQVRLPAVTKLKR